MVGVAGRLVAVLVVIMLTGCNTEQQAPTSPPATPVAAFGALDTSALLKHKMECRALGIQAEEESFPEGKNTVQTANQGFVLFDSIYTYNEKLNTCLMLSGFQLTNLKTMKLTTFQVTLTDLLSNNMLGTYTVIGGRISPASMTKVAFIGKARELVGEPLPRWVEQAPTPQS